MSISALATAKIGDDAESGEQSPDYIAADHRHWKE